MVGGEDAAAAAAAAVPGNTQEQALAKITVHVDGLSTTGGGGGGAAAGGCRYSTPPRGKEKIEIHCLASDDLRD